MEESDGRLEVWQDLARLTRAHNHCFAYEQEQIRELQAQVKALQAVVSDMIGALSDAGIRAPQAEA